MAPALDSTGADGLRADIGKQLQDLSVSALEAVPVRPDEDFRNDADSVDGHADTPADDAIESEDSGIATSRLIDWDDMLEHAMRAQQDPWTQFLKRAGEPTGSDASGPAVLKGEVTGMVLKTLRYYIEATADMSTEQLKATMQLRGVRAA